MNKDWIDKQIDDAAERLRTPLDVPRERMWARIDSERATRRSRRDDAGGAGPGLRRDSNTWNRSIRRWWPAAAAALLFLGFGLGRLNGFNLSSPEVPGTEQQVAVEQPSVAEPVLPTNDPAAPAATGETTWATTTTGMFQRAEALLAAFDQADPRAPIADPVPRWAGLLLYETRVLMDAPSAGDPELVALLEDLELVLAQIVHLGDGDRSDPSAKTGDQDAAVDQLWAEIRPTQSDRTWIADGLNKRATLQRLRQHTKTGVEQNSL